MEQSKGMEYGIRKASSDVVKPHYIIIIIIIITSFLRVLLKCKNLMINVGPNVGIN